jgi:chemotaxis protein methyltransferase CheR
MAVSIGAVPKMANAVQQLETDLLLEALYQLYGSDFRGYERTVIGGKLSAFMQENGLASISSVQDRAIHDPAVAAGLLRALTFRVAGAFDRASAFGGLRVLAEPLLRSYARPKIWIPECASAEEVFALAVLAEEAAVYDRVVIHATCSNPALLEEIKEGRFALDQADDYEANYLAGGGKAAFSKYWSKKRGHAVFDPCLRRNITFSEYHPSTDTSFNEFHLIVCRDRLAEYGPALRRRILNLFADSLVRFGILFTDPLDEFEEFPFTNNYNAISREHGIYRRTYRLGSPMPAGAQA